MTESVIKYGYLIKQENLVSLNKKILPNTFVLEANDPFPGYFEYHQEISFDVRPHYIYYITSKIYTLEKFTRATIEVKKHFKHDFSAAIGTIEFKNKLLPVIRIRRLKSFDLISNLQQAYIDQGIRLRKKPNSTVNECCMIHLEKFYILKKVDKGIFSDLHNPNLYYFEIPKRVNWPRFVNITKAVRYNVDILHFDASKGWFVEPYNIIDIVRIYGMYLSIRKMRQLKTQYLERL